MENKTITIELSHDTYQEFKNACTGIGCQVPRLAADLITAFIEMKKRADNYLEK